MQARRTGGGVRRRRGADLAPLETLEGRDLLAYTPLGVSLPDLAASGFAAPVAAWNGPLAVTVDVRNLGASSLTEPLGLEPGTTSTADAPPSDVGVFISSRPFFRPGTSLQVGSLPVGEIRQNTL